MSDLLILLFIPLFASLFFFFFGKAWKPAAIIISSLPLAFLVYHHHDWVGQQFSTPWAPALHINFALRCDSLSLLFLYLTAVIIPLGLAALLTRRLVYPGIFYGLIFLLQALLFGFFTAADLVLFAVFWEAILLPLYFMITLFGGPQRDQAALKFIIYMVAGSVMMIAAILALYFGAASMNGGEGTFNLEALAAVIPHLPWAMTISALFILAFAVKTPLFPFHGWLPETYYQASTVGTIFLAALLSKAGIYGFFRIGGGLFPEQMLLWNPWLLGLAVTGTLYGAFAAWQQEDLKKVIAYSSLSHVNFILVGVFLWSALAHQGSLLQVINHGVTITALFLSIGWLKERTGTTSIKHLGGLAKIFPYLCWTTLIFVLSSIALPGMNNFVGEFLIFLAFFKQNMIGTALLVTTVILSVVYMLRWMQRVYFGPLHVPHNISSDLSIKEMALSLPLLILIFWIGINPMPALKIAESATKNFDVEVQRMQREHKRTI